jgi:ElaB/YqjD/DUF883 family membrane-anchored ribosome-binding protein
MLVTKYRGLLTDREREVLSGVADVDDNYVYQIRSRVREKIDRLEDDVQLLEQHHPDIAEELRAAVNAAG